MIKPLLTLLVLALALGAGSAQLPGGPAKEPAPKVLDPKSVTPGFAVAITMEPARFHKEAKAAGLAVDEWWKLARDRTGVDLTKVERATALYEPLMGTSVLGMGAVALRYPKGTDPQARLAELLGGEPTKVKIGGQTYYKSKKYNYLDQKTLEVAGQVSADGTVLISVWPVLENMLGIAWDEQRTLDDLDRGLQRGVGFAGMAPATGKPTPLGTALAEADPNHDLVMVLAFQPVLDKLAKRKGWKDPPDELAPEDRPIWTGFKKVTAVVVAVDFRADAFMRVEFRTPDADAAGAVRDGLKALLTKGKAAYPNLRKELLQDVSPNVREPLLAIFGEVVNDPTVTVAKNTVVLTIKRPKDLVPQK